jgi:hypothetical protein
MIDMLTSQEFRRLIVRMGGLWTASDLGRMFGRRARLWVTDDDWPASAWEAGSIKLYPGLEVWNWLVKTEKWTDAELFKAELDSMDRRKFEKA